MREVGLIKGARGLPKFTADCGFWRHPRWKGAELAEMGLFIACLSYCYEHATDGELPGPDPEDLAASLGLKLRQVRPALVSLLARGSLTANLDGFTIAGFAEHNPTRVEILAHRQKRVDAGRKAAEARWGKRDAPDEECVDACESHSESDTNANARVEESRGEYVENVRTNPPVALARLPVDQVGVVFDAWKEATGRHKSVLDRKRRELIQRRLREHPVDDLVDACRGVVLFAHNRGETNGTRYDDLELVLRDVAHIERFRDRYRREDSPAPRMPTGSDMTARNLARMEANRGTS